MGNLLAQGSAWLSAKLKAHAATEITYHFGGASVVLTATIGQTEFDVTDLETSAVTRIESRDFIVSAADLVLDGNPVLPQRSALIQELGGDGKLRTYEVLPAASRTPHYRWSDPYHERLRIHTKLVKVEESES